MTAGDWRPSADPDTLAARSRFLAAIRAFFAERGVIEADVPALSGAAAVEPNLASIACETAHGPRYLHTSPEFGIKRLLAAGSGAVYQLSHVFRDGEQGRWHNPEFTMLEWYRPGWDEWRLADELDALLAALGIVAPAERRAFGDVFSEATGLDPFTADANALACCAGDLGYDVGDPPGDPRDARPFWIDALVGMHIGPRLGLEQPCLIHDFPPDMAGLTRVRDGNPATASRFELYWRGIELANGGDELTDARTLRERFRTDLAARQRQSLPLPPPSEQLLHALEDGLPQCSGVAVGVDRLLALQLGYDSLTPVLPFPAERG